MGDSADVTGVEFEWRRRRLGLNRREMGRCVSMVFDGPDARPVAEATIAKWERGSRDLPNGLDARVLFDRLDALMDGLRRVAYRMLSGTEPDGDGVVRVVCYRRDESFWRAVPRLRGWPYVMWNNALTDAMVRLRAEAGDVSYVMEVESED